MKQNIIRLVAIEIDNVKNVKHGRLELAKSKKGSILGIYGQNGSGKTVVVDCMVLLKCLFGGKTISQGKVKDLTLPSFYEGGSFT